jgi:hypothetical protein
MIVKGWLAAAWLWGFPMIKKDHAVKVASGRKHRTESPRIPTFVY